MKKLLKAIISLAYATLIVLTVIYARKTTIDDLVNYTPDNIILSSLFIFFLYALKSVSIFFPIMALQIASGFLFHPAYALIVNIAGTCIVYTIPYYIGKFSGAQRAEQTINKNKTISEFFKRQHNHEFFISFFLRAVSCLPGDIVSMYLGALKFNFPKYLFASVLGTLPGLIPATLMGTKVTDPTSPEFITALTVTVLSVVLSAVYYYFYTKRQRSVPLHPHRVPTQSKTDK